MIVEFILVIEGKFFDVRILKIGKISQIWNEKIVKDVSSCNLWCEPISRYKRIYYKKILNFQIEIRATKEKYVCNKS